MPPIPKQTLMLSVIIPTIGRKNELFNTLKDLGKQDLDHYKWECLIITQSEIDTESIRSIAIEYRINIKVFYSLAPNASLARNIGLIESNGEIVLFLDDDLIISNPNFLNNHLLNYKKEPDLPGVFGQVVDPGIPPRDTRHKLSHHKRVGWLFFPPNFNKNSKIQTGSSNNLSVKKELALNVGGMDYTYEKGAHREESDFCLRLTKQYGLLNFDPKASVIHLGAATGGCRNWGKNEGIHPMHHILGEWYFILKGVKTGTVKWYDLHYHLAVLFFRQIWNAPNKANPLVIPKAIARSIKGFFKALKALTKTPNTLLPEKYNYKILLEYTP